MAHKILFVLLISLFTFSCEQSTPTKTSGIKLSELKEIFSTLEKRNDLTKIRTLLVDSIVNFNIKSIQREKIIYTIASTNELQNGIWTSKVFDNADIVPKQSIDLLAKQDSLSLPPTHYQFSLPYFSKDKNSFIIFFDFYCGMLCAEYSERLYRKINGKWTFVKTYMSIAS